MHRQLQESRKIAIRAGEHGTGTHPGVLQFGDGAASGQGAWQERLQVGYPLVREELQATCNELFDRRNFVS